MHFKKFLANQKEEMERYKWIQSQKAGKDLGDAAIKEWVEKFAAQYRKEYEETFNAMVEKTAKRCKDKLKGKMPTVSEEIWNYFFTEVIKSFTEVWTEEMSCCCDKDKKKHLDEI